MPSFVKVYSHNSTFSYSTGIRVRLTPPNHLRTMGYASYIAAPGFSTSLDFEVTKHIRLPYNQCTHTSSNTDNSNESYSYVECQNECIHADVFGKCGCRSTGFLARNLKNISSCGQFLLTNKSKSDNLLECQRAVTRKAIHTPNYFIKNCKCFWPCSDTKYPVTMSQSKWPARQSLKYFLHKTLQSNPRQKKLKAYKHFQFLQKTNASEDQLYYWVTNHFLRLNVYARSDLVLVKEETAKYTLTNLMSSIGGCLGLWVGFSVLTFSKLCNFFLGVPGEKKRDRET